MLRRSFLPALLGLALAASTTNYTEESSVISERYIVEASEDASLGALEESLLSNPDTKVVKRFNHAVFTGLSIESTSESVPKLSSRKEVSRAWTSNRIVLGIPDAGSTLQQADQETVAEDEIPSNLTYNLHSFTGVDRVHASGILGQGVKVAVIDTGIFYTHPALGGGYGPGFKIGGGYDLVGGSYPTSDIRPDDDPYPESRDPALYQNDHGTHVAGIIAGNSEWFIGVAPEATIFAYKVFGHTNVGEEEIFIEAFLRAYDDGADIINASIGAQGGFSDSAWAAVGSRLVDEGVIVVVAAGNNGRSGPFFLDSGAGGTNVLAVGAIEPPNKPGNLHITARFEDEHETILPLMTRSDPEGFSQAANLPIWTPSKGINPCEGLQDDVDIGDYVVLVSQAGCTYDTIIKNLTDRNATYIIFYNDGQILTPPSENHPDVSLPFFAGIIEESSAEEIQAALDSSEAVHVTVSAPHKGHPLNLFDPYGGRPTEFTSWGGLYDLHLKPDISAYGGQIYSTAFYLAGDGGFAPTWKTFGGTSFSAPYVSGVAALWINRYGGRDRHGPGFAKELHQRIISSGQTVNWGVPLEDDLPTPNPPPSNALAPASHVGTGLVDAWKVLTYSTTLKHESFSLNDTANFVPTHSLEITNGASELVTYSFAHQPLTGYEARASEGLSIAGYNQLKLIDLAATVELPAEITVAPGEIAEVQFTFGRPVYSDESKLPCYSGKVLVRSSTDEELAVPYFGVSFSLKDQFPTVFTPGSPKVESINAVSNYTFEWFNETFTTPRISVETLFGTRELRFDLYESDWKESSWSYPPIPDQGGYVGSVVDVLEIISLQPPPRRHPFPLKYYPRSDTEGFTERHYAWQGELAHGAWVEPGTYFTRVAALRPFGDPKVSEDWDIWDAPEITITSAA